MITYEKTADKNIIRKIEIVKSEIYLDKLNKDKSNLEIVLASMPKVKITPDIESLEYWNNHIEEKKEIEENLQKKKDLLDIINSLK